jgi:HEAT repeat protein
MKRDHTSLIAVLVVILVFTVWGIIARNNQRNEPPQRANLTGPPQEKQPEPREKERPGAHLRRVFKVGFVQAQADAAFWKELADIEKGGPAAVALAPELEMILVGCIPLDKKYDTDRAKIFKVLQAVDPAWAMRLLDKLLGDNVDNYGKQELAASIGRRRLVPVLMPALVAHLRRARELDKQWTVMLQLLHAIDKEQQPKIRAEMATDPSATVRWAALAWAAAYRYPDAVDYMVLLHQGLHDTDEKIVRFSAEEAAWRNLTTGDIEPVLPRLRQLLGGDDPALRLAAAHALAWHSPADVDDIVPVVVSALTDSKAVEPHSTAILLRLGPGAKAAVPAFEKHLREGHARFLAITPALGDAAGPLVPVLVDLLKSLKTRFQALRALDLLGPTAKESVPALREAMHDADDIVRFYAFLALASVDAKAAGEELPVSLRPLAAAAESAKLPADRQDLCYRLEEREDTHWRMQNVYKALGKLDPLDRDAVPFLRLIYPRGSASPVTLGVVEKLGPAALPLAPLVADDLQNHADEALRALLAMGPKAMPALRAGLEKSCPENYGPAFAFDAVLKLGARAAEVVPILVALLGEGSPKAKLEVLRILPKLGADRGPLIPPLRKALNDKQSYVRKQACATIGRIGLAAKDTIPDLIERFREDYNPDRVREAAIDAVVLMRNEAVGPLLKALGHKEPRVRLGVVEALTHLERYIDDPGPVATASSAVAANQQETYEVREAAARLASKLQGAKDR